MHRAKPVLILVMVVLLLGACRPGPRPQELEWPLLQLTTLVAGEVRHPGPQGPIADEDLVPAAYRKAPELEKAFHGVRVIAQPNKKNVVLLVLSPNGRHAWLEDESSTPKLDKQWYKCNKDQPPVFTLAPSEE